MLTEMEGQEYKPDVVAIVVCSGFTDDMPCVNDPVVGVTGISSYGV